MLYGLKGFRRESVEMLKQRDWMGCCGTESKTTRARHCSREVVPTRYEVSYLTLYYSCIMKLFSNLPYTFFCKFYPLPSPRIV